MMCDEARKHGVYLVGGSVPEREGDSVYNTCVVVNPDGDIIGKHRKVHLFDIDVRLTYTWCAATSTATSTHPVVPTLCVWTLVLYGNMFINQVYSSLRTTGAG